MGQMEHNFTYWPPDLAEFVYTFYQRRFFGMKGYELPVHPHYRVARMRFLLVKLTDGILEDVFRSARHEETSGFSREDDAGQILLNGLLFNNHAAAAASWMAGLSGKTDFIQQIAETVSSHQKGYGFAPPLCGLLLLEDEKVLPILEGFLRDHRQENRLLKKCVEWLEARLAGQYEGNTDLSTGPGINPKLDRMLNFSLMLRGGARMDSPKTFRQELEHLSRLGTPPGQKWILDAPRLRTFRQGWSDIEVRPVRREKPEPNAVLNRFAKGRLPGHPFRWHFRSAVERFGSLRGSRYDLIDAVRKAEHAWDLLAGLEYDLDYRIPLEVVRLAFQKMIQWNPWWFETYRNYAVQLMMRGTAYDEEASALLQKADYLRSQFDTVELDFHAFPVLPNRGLKGAKRNPGEPLKTGF